MPSAEFNEKEGLPLPTTTTTPLEKTYSRKFTSETSEDHEDSRTPFKSQSAILLGILCTLLVVSTLWHQQWSSVPTRLLFSDHYVVSNPAAVCPQAAPIAPSGHADLLKDLESQFTGRLWREGAYRTLGGAVRIPTVTYDDMKPVGQDTRWDIFSTLHTYLARMFPLVHQNLTKTEINTYGLVFTWKGSDSSLKPILLAAHQDVVPVAPSTIKKWLMAPFSGTYDGKWIWGRGSCDDKPGLIGSLYAVESLLEKGFTPKRTIILAYGFDEERGGPYGAASIRDYLVSTYGNNSFALILDEGGSMEIRDNVVIASPGVAEKGSFNMRVEVTMPGGHSSIPPPHTSIGALSAAIVQLESNPFKPHLYRNTTYYTNLQCRAAYDPDMSSDLRDLIQRSSTNDWALENLEEGIFQADPGARALGGTTQAVDIVQGGVKVNALPELAYAIVNYRIAGYSSVATVKSRLTTVLSPIAKKYNLTYVPFGQSSTSTAAPTAGTLTLSNPSGAALEPAPITPTVPNPAYQFLAGTIINSLRTSTRIGNDVPVIVAPGSGTGNTDTKYYWKLSKNIFRYGHINKYDMYNGAHTVNEGLIAEAFIDVIRLFTMIILNADETKLL